MLGFYSVMATESSLQMWVHNYLSQNGYYLFNKYVLLPVSKHVV